ncbi:heterokaryon incompatibility protein-domain-containing protein, partial [Microdochium trichocladiopsis]
QRHTGSSKWSRSQPLPARLVRLGNGEDETAPTRLVLTSEEETSNKKIAYATLSHCWGDYQPLQTTTHTLLSFQARLPKEQTPRTFRDAMDICRAVGIQYLWIDSLCIVQDDNDDWCREAARMKDIYSGSLLTIAATGARNSSGGCFYDDSKEEEWDSVWPQDNLPHISKSAFTKRPEFTHLNTRGWVLQEQALSPRVVYCMQPEMHFICRTVNCTEAGASFVHAARDRVHWHNPTIRSLSEGMDPAHIHQVWSDWMEHYSRRSFTYPQDRLSAIAGLVEEYARYSGDEHLLGCWKRTVRQDLMWTR